MVHSVRSSQQLLAWGVNVALGTLIHLFENANGHLGKADLRLVLEESAAPYKISGRQVSRMAYELKRRRYLDFMEGDSVLLTDKARIKMIDHIVDLRQLDGKCRLISFDIPEAKRSNRNNFRRAIKRMGFRQVQKSLWVIKRNVADLVEAAMAEYRVGDYVAYFVADRSNIDQHIAHVLEGDGRPSKAKG